MITNYPTDRFFSRSAFLVGQAQRRVEQARKGVERAERAFDPTSGESVYLDALVASLVEKREALRALREIRETDRSVLS